MPKILKKSRKSDSSLCPGGSAGQRLGRRHQCWTWSEFGKHGFFCTKHSQFIGGFHWACVGEWVPLFGFWKCYPHVPSTPELMNVLHSSIIGSGDDHFIILHGFLGMGDNWKTHAKNLSEKEYCVHLVDQRNHGRSFGAINLIMM